MLKRITVVLALGSLPYLISNATGLVNPILLDHPDAIIPMSLQESRIRDPKAEVRVVISETGEVTDAICIYADDYRMAERAESLARRYQFEPARSNGQAIAVTQNLVINFEYRSSYITSVDGFSNMVDFIGPQATNEYQLNLVDPRELDEPLKIIARPDPVLIRNENGEVEAGQALISGFVDADGNFRFLTVDKADNRYIAEAALANFKQLQFSPPRKDGKPAVCQIRIPFQAAQN